MKSCVNIGKWYYPFKYLLRLKVIPFLIKRAWYELGIS